MTEKTYRFNTTRLITLWLLPAFFTFLTFCIIDLRVESVQRLTLTDIFAWTLLFMFTVGVFVFLFFNHLPFARQTQLIIAGKAFKIIQGEQSYSANFSEVEEILEYSSNKLPWGFVMKWKIRTADKEIVVSSLTISQFNFERHFYNKIRHKVSLLPTI